MKKSLLVLSTVAGMATLLGAGIAQAQDVYVTDQTGDELTVIGPGGTLSNIVNPPSQTYLDEPSGIAVDTNLSSSYYGDVFISNLGSGSIVTYDPTTNAFATFATGLSDPYGMSFDGNGNLYVASETPTGAIIQYSGTNLGTVNNTYATGPAFPIGITATGFGQLYVTSGSTGLISQVAPGGGAAATFTPTATPNGALGVVIGPNGDLYVVNSSTPNVEQIKVNGNSSVAVATAGSHIVGSPAGLAFDADGNLYVADYSNNTVTEYDLTGFNQLGQTTYSWEQTFGLGSDFFNGPDFIAFDPVSQTVPEPGTYAMLFGGLAMLYVMQRRRTAALAKI